MDSIHGFSAWVAMGWFGGNQCDMRNVLSPADTGPAIKPNAAMVMA